MRPVIENLFLRVVSLGLAVLLWYVIAGEKTSEMGLSVPVELQNFPPDLELTGDSLNTVEVRLRASPGVIQNLGRGDISALIDVAGAGEGERIVHLTPETIRVPFGVKVVKVNPAILTLTFERTLERAVPVKPRVIGRPAAGHEVAEAVADPREVRISGPRTRVQVLETAFTEPVSVEGAEGPVTRTVSVGLGDPLLRIAGPPRVRVTVDVRETRDKRVFSGVPVEVRGGAASVQPSTVRVTLSGPASVLARVTVSDLRTFVEMTRPQAVQRLPVRVELGSGLTGVSLDRLDPAQVTVRATERGRR